MKDLLRTTSTDEGPSVGELLVAFGYDYVMADPFLLAACFQLKQ